MPCNQCCESRVPKLKTFFNARRLDKASGDARWSLDLQLEIVQAVASRNDFMIMAGRRDTSDTTLRVIKFSLTTGLIEWQTNIDLTGTAIESSQIYLFSALDGTYLYLDSAGEYDDDVGWKLDLTTGAATAIGKPSSTRVYAVSKSGDIAAKTSGGTTYLNGSEYDIDTAISNLLANPGPTTLWKQALDDFTGPINEGSFFIDGDIFVGTYSKNAGTTGVPFYPYGASERLVKINENGTISQSDFYDISFTEITGTETITATRTTSYPVPRWLGGACMSAALANFNYDTDGAGEYTEYIDDIEYTTAPDYERPAGVFSDGYDSDQAGADDIVEYAAYFKFVSNYGPGQDETVETYSPGFQLSGSSMLMNQGGQVSTQSHTHMQRDTNNLQIKSFGLNDWIVNGSQVVFSGQYAEDSGTETQADAEGHASSGNGHAVHFTEIQDCSASPGFYKVYDASANAFAENAVPTITWNYTYLNAPFEVHWHKHQKVTRGYVDDLLQLNLYPDAAVRFLENDYEDPGNTYYYLSSGQGTGVSYIRKVTNSKTEASIRTEQARFNTDYVIGINITSNKIIVEKVGTTELTDWSFSHSAGTVTASSFGCFAYGAPTDKIYAAYNHPTTSNRMAAKLAVDDSNMLDVDWEVAHVVIYNAPGTGVLRTHLEDLIFGGNRAYAV